MPNSAEGNFPLHRIIATGLGLVLIVASGFKGHHLLTDFAAGYTLLTSREVQLLAVLSEIALGLWLVSGIGRRLAWISSLIYLVGLAGVSGYQAATGEGCCGCLGRLAISPWYTFSFNLTAIAMLTLLGPPPATVCNSAFQRPRATLATSAVFLFWAAFVLTAEFLPPLTSQELTEAVADGPRQVRVIEAADWIGQPFPWLAETGLGRQLMEGQWRLLMSQGDHREGYEALRRYELQNDSAREIRVAVVQIPNFGQLAPFIPWQHSSGYPHAYLNLLETLILPQTTWVLLENGQMKDAAV